MEAENGIFSFQGLIFSFMLDLGSVFQEETDQVTTKQFFF